MNKAKILVWVVAVQILFCVFFLLFAVVARQQAEKNLRLAEENYIKLKECQEKNK